MRGTHTLSNILLGSTDLPCVACREKGYNNSEWSRCLDELSAEEVVPVVDKKLLKIESIIK